MATEGPDVPVTPDAPEKPEAPGLMGKPMIEKLKLVGLFVLIGVLVYYSTPTPNTMVIGSALVVIGTLIRIWAGGHLTRDQKLTTSGPYQYSRNPFYLGRFLLLIGFGIMTGLGHPAVVAALVIALVIFFAYYMPRKEEREGGRLKVLFGPDYETWKSNVPSLFPRLTPYKMNPKKWSSRLFMGGDDQHTGNKELWTTIGIIIIVGLFYWRYMSMGTGS